MEDDIDVQDTIEEMLCHQECWIEAEMGENLAHLIKQEIKEHSFD